MERTPEPPTIPPLPPRYELLGYYNVDRGIDSLLELHGPNPVALGWSKGFPLTLPIDSPYRMSSVHPAAYGATR